MFHESWRHPILAKIPLFLTTELHVSCNVGQWNMPCSYSKALRIFQGPKCMCIVWFEIAIISALYWTKAMGYPCSSKSMADTHAQKSRDTHAVREGRLRTGVRHFRASKIVLDPFVSATNSTYYVTSLFSMLSNAIIKRARHFTPYLLLEAVS